MPRKLFRSVIFTILFTLSISNTVYAYPAQITHPYGPKVSDLQEKDDILKGFDEINKIRANLSVINIKANTPVEELNKTYITLETYIGQLRIIRANLVRHSDIYKDSISDVFFSEQIVAISDCYIISIKHQQLLIREIQNNPDKDFTLFYSTYMIPIYYYLTQGDQLISYTQTYIVVS